MHACVRGVQTCAHATVLARVVFDAYITACVRACLVRVCSDMRLDMCLDMCLRAWRGCSSISKKLSGGGSTLLRVRMSRDTN